jgi:hypothetical protein
MDRPRGAELSTKIEHGQVPLHLGDSSTILSTMPKAYFDWPRRDTGLCGPREGARLVSSVRCYIVR